MQAKSLRPGDDKSLRWRQDEHTHRPIAEEPDMTNQSFWGMHFGRDPKLRAADADREATAEQLRRSHSEGRLDTTELQQRLERCYEAKTVGELDELVTDLPREGAEERTRGPHFPSWRWRLAPLIPLLIALIVICAVTGHHFFWLLIPVAFLVYRMWWWRWRPARMAGGRGPGAWL
jgi:hypothetical protein